MDTLLLSGLESTGSLFSGDMASGYIDTLAQTPVVGSFVDILQRFVPMAWIDSTNLPFLIIVFLWVLIIFWVLKDSTYRSSNGFFPIFSLLLVTLATPVIGLPIYLAIRPIGYKYKRQYWRHIMREHKKEYWKNAMEEYNYDLPETWYEPEVAQEDDNIHLTKLQQQATLAEKRTKRTIKKSPAKKSVAVKTTKKAVVKTKTPASTVSSRKIPTAKKAVTRTAKK